MKHAKKPLFETSMGRDRKERGAIPHHPEQEHPEPEAREPDIDMMSRMCLTRQAVESMGLPYIEDVAERASMVCSEHADAIEARLHEEAAHEEYYAVFVQILRERYERELCAFPKASA